MLLRIMTLHTITTPHLLLDRGSGSMLLGIIVMAIVQGLLFRLGATLLLFELRYKRRRR
jgi:hypothetical protein